MEERKDAGWLDCKMRKKVVQWKEGRTALLQTGSLFRRPGPVLEVWQYIELNNLEDHQKKNLLKWLKVHFKTNKIILYQWFKSDGIIKKKILTLVVFFF